MNTGVKVFLACMLGALIGGLVALELSPSWWWLGAGLGFLVGYLSYEFEKIIAAVQTAFWKVYGWRPDFSEAASIASSFVDAFFCAFTFFFTVFVGNISLFCLLVFPSEVSAVLILSSILGFVASLFCGLLAEGEEESQKYFWEVILLANVVRVYCYWLPLGILWVLGKTPAFLKDSFEVAKKTFILVHSDMRLLCGINAAIGTGVGFFVGSAILGTGGALGFTNFYLVSVRWLKLVPKRGR